VNPEEYWPYSSGDVVPWLLYTEEQTLAIVFAQSHEDAVVTATDEGYLDDFDTDVNAVQLDNAPYGVSMAFDAE
jgi:hypothetical protein